MSYSNASRIHSLVSSKVAAVACSVLSFGLAEEEIDVDKLDYLIRDAYITGFDTVNIDYERCVRYRILRKKMRWTAIL